MCGGDSIYVPSHPSHSGSSPLAFPLLLRFALVLGGAKNIHFFGLTSRWVSGVLGRHSIHYFSKRPWALEVCSGT